jgi:hypothetical protein
VRSAGRDTAGPLDPPRRGRGEGVQEVQVGLRERGGAEQSESRHRMQRERGELADVCRGGRLEYSEETSPIRVPYYEQSSTYRAPFPVQLGGAIAEGPGKAAAHAGPVARGRGWSVRSPVTENST